MSVLPLVLRQHSLFKKKSSPGTELVPRPTLPAPPFCSSVHVLGTDAMGLLVSLVIFQRQALKRMGCIICSFPPRASIYCFPGGYFPAARRPSTERTEQQRQRRESPCHSSGRFAPTRRGGGAGRRAGEESLEGSRWRRRQRRGRWGGGGAGGDPENNRGGGSSGAKTAPVGTARERVGGGVCRRDRLGVGPGGESMRREYNGMGESGAPRRYVGTFLCSSTVVGWRPSALVLGRWHPPCTAAWSVGKEPASRRSRHSSTHDHCLFFYYCSSLPTTNGVVVVLVLLSSRPEGGREGGPWRSSPSPA